MRFRFGAIALALLLVLVAAGCGKKKVAVVETTATAPLVTTTAATTSGGSSSTTTTEDNGGTSTSGSGAPKGTLTKDCAQLLSLGQKFSAAVQAASGGGSAEAVAKEVQLFKELADASPSEIHDDFETIADAFAASATALKEADLKPGKTPTAKQLAQLAAASKSFSSAKVQAASKHLEAWGEKNCGGLNTTTG
jgi:hypothetical protein